MRKSIIAVAAASALLTSGAAAAIAQDPPTSTVDVTLSPNKAGTKSKPKATKLVLKIKNTAEKQTASELKIVAPKGIVLTTKDFKFCNAAKLAAQGPKACPSGSQIGPKGEAHALAAVSGTAPSPVTFDVTPFATGKKTIGFYLQLGGGAITGLAKGTISGRTLKVAIPKTPAQEFPTGVYNGLVDITANLWVKKGKSVVKITSCPKNKKLRFKNTIKFVPNPSAPAIPTHTATDDVTCK